jgi:Tol biopolymer transport system component
MNRPRSLVAALLVTVTVMLGPLAFGPIPALASFHGPTGRIAFLDFMTSQIYAVNADGSGLARLTNEATGFVARWPNWSPDGSRLLFVRINTSDGMGRVWIMNADGSQPHQLASDAPGYRDYQPRFTPDGSHIVFSRCKPGNGVCAIWIMRADGTNKQPITPYKEGPRDAVDFDPSVSPDGSRVAYTAFGQNGITAQVRIVRVNGADNEPVSPPSLEAGHPDWAPDGDRIAFTSNAPTINSNVYTMEANGADITRLTRTPWPNNSFGSSYSQDGSQIAFSSDRRYSNLCCVDLFIMNADGSHQHLVPTGLKGVVDVAWGTA